jgi:ADP-heptose:LPS heptosyltransferase
MKTAQRKAKGRGLVVEVKAWLHKMFPEFADGDVIVPTTSQPGMDLKLSPAIAEIFPYAIECKRTEGLAQDYRFMEQAKANAENLTPIVIMRSNHKTALVMLYLTDFEKLIGG